jgi:hypothetical protein
MISRVRMLCPGCYAQEESCWICDENGQIEFWLPEDQLESFRYDPCIVLETKSDPLA